MPFDINTPEREQKIAQYLRMIKKSAPEWKPKYLKPLEEKRKKDNKKPGPKI